MEKFHIELLVIALSIMDVILFDYIITTNNLKHIVTKIPYVVIDDEDDEDEEKHESLYHKIINYTGKNFYIVLSARVIIYIITGK